MARLGDLLGALRRLDRLIRNEEIYGRRIDDLSDRQTRQEAREEILIAKAEAAAASAGSAVASHHIGDIARRLGSLEERVSQLERSGGPPRLRR